MVRSGGGRTVVHTSSTVQLYRDTKIGITRLTEYAANAFSTRDGDMVSYTSDVTIRSASGRGWVEGVIRLSVTGGQTKRYAPESVRGASFVYRG